MKSSMKEPFSIFLIEILEMMNIEAWRGIVKKRLMTFVEQVWEWL